MVKISSYLSLTEATWVKNLVGINTFVKYVNTLYLSRQISIEDATRIALHDFTQEIIKEPIPLEYAEEVVNNQTKHLIHNLKRVFYHTT